MRALVNVLVLFVFIVSCSSTTLINVSDKDAKIFADDQLIGKGSAVYTDTKILNSVTYVKLKKDGCEDVMYSFQRNEEVDWLACVGGCLVLVPFLWIQKYKPNRTYDFECTPKKK